MYKHDLEIKIAHSNFVLIYIEIFFINSTVLPPLEVLNIKWNPDLYFITNMHKLTKFGDTKQIDNGQFNIYNHKLSLV